MTTFRVDDKVKYIGTVYHAISQGVVVRIEDGLIGVKFEENGGALFCYERELELVAPDVEEDYYFRIGESIIGPRRLTREMAESTVVTLKMVHTEVKLLAEVK